MASLLEQADNDFTRVAAKCAAETRLAPAIETMAKLVELLGRPVILAGGAVRDAMLERSIKDYDFFTSDTDFDTLAKIQFVLGTTIKLVDMDYHGEPSLIGRDVKCIVNWTDPGSNIPSQLIVLRGEARINPDVAVTRFDFGLCQCACSVTPFADDVAGTRYVGGFHFTDAFWSDVSKRRMTYLKSMTDTEQMARSMRRFDRLSQKYLGYIFYTPILPQ